jgi:hypothetical protein
MLFAGAVKAAPAEFQNDQKSFCSFTTQIRVGDRSICPSNGRTTFTQVSSGEAGTFMARLLTHLPFLPFTYGLLIFEPSALLTGKENDFDAANRLYSAALPDRPLSDRAEAEGLYSEALRVFQKIHSKSDREAATVFRDLRRLQKQMRNDAKAKQFYREALQIWRTASGS